ncbi:Oxidoreductase family, C-terminal alpha/beta domain [Paenibacillus sp. 1_12]|uniref:Gfo/Idh/MocA family protein n=1 Tax=Paenibacillus sp. 1_12 TaxID=1566278 RepID=UPI0008EF24CB|nr:Gfo/Idh/MocA family oxidoreductase [Paenibacillus sp. 1_12]SFL24403.1 Oxidoreductase family, C-terminal alpha/beta domain [Paenibacillus sp. 1_12]
MNVQANMFKPVTAIIVGAGQRSLIYASYAELYPDQLRIVGIVEPDSERRQLAAARFTISAENTFASVEELLSYDQLADAVINGTMDELHVKTTLPLLKHGYHVLLEKPIGVTEEETLALEAAALKHNRTVMICHVLRYAPFYKMVKQLVSDGEIGEILTIHTSEHVSYHHMAVSFIRGKWSSEAQCGSSMLMAKCCHDLDLVSWLMGEARPNQVSSFGSLMQFRPEKAPAGAGSRCLTDCTIEESCMYSARKHYLNMDRWGFYVWNNYHLGIRMSEEDKLESLRTDNPYGRCVWHCDNDVVDHQSVIIEFNNQATASHNMVGTASRSCRILHIIGTLGEIQGVLEDGYFYLRQPDPVKGREYKEQKMVVDVANDSHGGGDLLLVEDFVRVLRGEQPSISSTTLGQSVDGHRIGFAAERSRRTNQQVLLDLK